MAQELAIAMPTTEEMTRVGLVGVAAAGTGAIEGITLSMAPKLGALELPFTWGMLLGVPVIGAAVALMTKGMLSDMGLGIMAGGAAQLGQTIPAMLQEFTLGKAPRGGLLNSGGGVKLLGQGAAEAARRVQQRASVGIEF